MKDRLLATLRPVIRDLVDKRLWPIAILLVAALVAVPVVIRSSSASDVPESMAALPVATPAPAAGAQAIVPAPTAGTARRRPGAVNDPFYDPPKPKSDEEAQAPARSPDVVGPPAGAAGGVAPPKAAEARKAPKAPKAQPGRTSPVAPGSSRGAAAAARTVYRTRLSWGTDKDAEVRGVSRLQPFGGLSKPALLYLGTTRYSDRAVFLLGPDVVADQTSTCAERTCRVIGLKAGESRSVDVQGVDGQTHQLTLAIDAVMRRVTSSQEEARALRARVYPGGRAALRAMIKDAKTAAAIGQFAFDRGVGAVVARRPGA